VLRSCSIFGLAGLEGVEGKEDMFQQSKVPLEIHTDFQLLVLLAMKNKQGQHQMLEGL